MRNEWNFQQEKKKKRKVKSLYNSIIDANWKTQYLSSEIIRYQKFV